MPSISPTQATVQAALLQFLQNVLPSDVVIVAGVQNRVPEPASGRFCVIIPIRFERLATNIDTSADCKFVGSADGQVLTVTEVLIGSLANGATIIPVAGLLSTPTTVGQQISGAIPGGTGTYQISQPQNLASQTMSCGQKILTQEARVVVQCDFHSSSGSNTSGYANTASDLAQILATCLRDEYGVNFFAGLAPPLNGVYPFYADDPKYVPFINDQNQYEYRWTLDAHFQVNQQVVLGQQYADAATVDVVSVDALLITPILTDDAVTYDLTSDDGSFILTQQ